MSGSRPRPGTGVLARESGQASVELVPVIPLVVTLGFVVFSFMAAAAADELAGRAAKAGAIALLQDRDPTEATRAALPGGSRRSTQIEVVAAGSPSRSDPAIRMSPARQRSRADARRQRTAYDGPDPPRCWRRHDQVRPRSCTANGDPN